MKAITKEEATQVFSRAYDAVSLGSEQLSQVGTLFSAIINYTDKNSMANELAGIGQYLAQDYGNMLDAMQEDLKLKIEANK